MQPEISAKPAKVSRKGKSAAVQFCRAQSSHRSADGGASIPEICQRLRELQTRRKFQLKVEVSNQNRLRGLIKSTLGVNSEQDEAAQKAAEKRSAGIIAKAFAGKPQDKNDEAVALALGPDIESTRLSMLPIIARRAEIERAMEKEAAHLPAVKFVRTVRGFGLKSLLGFAVIIGECGDLSNYSTRDKVWKRLGLAPYEGKALSSWRKQGGLTKEEWSDEKKTGYCPRRRSEVWNFAGKHLVNAQMVSIEKSGTPFGKPTGPYGAVYVKRREHTAVTHSDWSKAHAREDALRITAKRLISDLWSEWRGATGRVRESASQAMPPPQVSAIAAE